MILIALVEDEAEVRAQLQGYVQRHTRQYGTEFAVMEFADGMELLDDYRPVYDILFLDVEMKHLDGMETARRVRELDGGWVGPVDTLDLPVEMVVDWVRYYKEKE